jgi:integrase
MPRTPSLRLHKPSGRAVVTISGRDHYVGKWGSSEAQQNYDQLIGEWLAAGRPRTIAREMTVAEVLADYLEYCETYYAPPSTDLPEIRRSLQPLKAYAEQPITAFGPNALRAIMDGWVKEDLSRKYINKRKAKIVAFMKWAVGREKAPASALERLKAVEALRAGKTEARETEERTPVDRSLVSATVPHLSRHLAAMVNLLLLTGARPKEVCYLTGEQIDQETDPTLWTYRPTQHKTKGRKQRRVIQFGPKAQEILRPFLRENPSEIIFQPREAVAEMREALKNPNRSERERARVRRAKRKPGVTNHRLPGERYSASTLGKALRRVRERHNIPPWTAYQLRHTNGTTVAAMYGADVARKVLGKKSVADMVRYDHSDEAEAARVMRIIG